MSKQAFLLYDSAVKAMENTVRSTEFVYASSEQEAKDKLLEKFDEDYRALIVSVGPATKMSSRGWRVHYTVRKPLERGAEPAS